VSYTVSWDGPSAEEPNRGHEVQVSTAAELDAVLDQVAAQASSEEVPYAVQIHQPGQHGAVMIGIGHPDRSFIDWLDRSEPHGTANRYGVESGLAPVAEPIGFDFYGDWTDMPPARTRITPSAAREAAREYVCTGQRPTTVEWFGN
jgi:hypothetical protein